MLNSPCSGVSATFKKFLFEIRDPEQTVKMAAESAMREVIGQNKLQFELDRRAQPNRRRYAQAAAETDGHLQCRRLVAQINLQTVSVPDEVKAAFQDVVNARLDRERSRTKPKRMPIRSFPKPRAKQLKSRSRPWLIAIRK